MKHLSSLILFLFIPLLTFAGHKDNGGGGIVRNGQYLTFGSAKIDLSSGSPLPVVSGIEQLASTIDTLINDPAVRGELLLNLFPSEKRQYFNISDKNLKDETVRELLELYKQKFGSSLEEQDTLTLYAVTSGHETYLLPSFYKLDPLAQQAILFHELLWSLDSELPLKSVIIAEMKMEDYLRMPNLQSDLRVIEVLSDILKRPDLLIAESVRRDAKNGETEIFRYWNTSTVKVIDSSFSWLDILGPEMVNTARAGGRLSYPIISDHLRRMVKANPNLQVFKALNRVSLKLKVGAYYKDEDSGGYVHMGNEGQNEWVKNLSENNLVNLGSIKTLNHRYALMGYGFEILPDPNKHAKSFLYFYSDDYVGGYL